MFYRVVRRGCVAGRVAGREGLGLLGRSRMPKANRPFSEQQHPVRFGRNTSLLEIELGLSVVVFLTCIVFF